MGKFIYIYFQFFRSLLCLTSFIQWFTYSSLLYFYEYFFSDSREYFCWNFWENVSSKFWTRRSRNPKIEILKKKILSFKILCQMCHSEILGVLNFFTWTGVHKQNLGGCFSKNPTKFKKISFEGVVTPK